MADDIQELNALIKDFIKGRSFNLLILVVARL
jgi:hypothetical protein